jgi:hypothetical protein
VIVIVDAEQTEAVLVALAMQVPFLVATQVLLTLRVLMKARVIQSALL